MKYSMTLNSCQIIRTVRRGNLKYVVLSEWSYNQWHSTECKAGKTWCMMLSSQIHVTALLPKHRTYNAECELWRPLGRCCLVNIGSLTITGALWWRGVTDNKEVIHALDWSSMWSPYLSNLVLILKKKKPKKIKKTKYPPKYPKSHILDTFSSCHLIPTKLLFSSITSGSTHGGKSR